MVSKQLISNLIPALNTSDTPSRALQIMDEYHLSQLPILHENNYIGLVAEDDLLDLDVTDKPFSVLEFEYTQAAITEDAHIFEALKIAKEFNLQTIPVITPQRKYVGSISQQNLLQYLADGTQFKQVGGIIVVTTDAKNYSLSQIARLAESDNITIISMQMHTQNDGSISLTLKTNKQDLRSLVASLERFNYTVTEEHEVAQQDFDAEDNYASFMKYLDL